ncbi:ubiquitin C-terminal hydrolase [Aspergillus sclerotioniger CBS 115572]|uniref:Ubiquitin C-terminal hydrolase n=1 Tax=Aspergillus sclerotioniger CBS 115572 TaxID=1450535 RepID=A0A317X4K7_9EURO|nr:ubiquitin C-terminal hydrolase [Aspergillus sclerotioniger CBS 115572]PWY93275.1 ubiquitin C-terminal hydrolase [Aspergillus sclerotioniger CBS 115572]
MAAAPLDSSSTPPDAISTDSTRPLGHPMEESDPQSTRKRPRLDSGSRACESWSASNETAASRLSNHIPDAPATTAQEASPSSRPASRVAIKLKPPTSGDKMASAPEDSPAEHSSGDLPAPSAGEAGVDISTAISLSSSPAQSPEIEVADLEDMDQDPNTSSWKSLGEAMREPETPDVVQLQAPLTDTFPRIHMGNELRENLEEICAIIEKGSQHDIPVFIAVKCWLDDVANNLDQLTYEVLAEDRDFWEELPTVVDSLLRRTSEFLPDEGRGPWTCLQEFFLDYAQLALQIVGLDTFLLTQVMEDADAQMSDPLSKAYLPSLGWVLQLNNIPFFRAMEKMHGSEVSNLLARTNDQVASSPLDIVQRLSEHAVCILTLITRWPQLSTSLVSIVTIVHNLLESGNERRRYRADDALMNSSVYSRTMKRAYTLIRAADDKYQTHITKKSPWVSSDTSESMLRLIAHSYLTLCRRDPDFSSQIANDLAIQLLEGLTPDDRSYIIHYGWKFAVLKKHIMDGRMELRVHGMEAMQTDLVNVWRQHIQNNPDGVEHPVVQYLVGFLRQNRIVEYIVGIDSHPQLISRSGNIVGFLVVTSTYTDADTDTIWKTVTESPDPRTVSEVLGMLGKTFHMHLPTSPALLYLCSKLLDLPLSRFDARMIDFCEQLLHQVREKYSDRTRRDLQDQIHVDAIPLRLCVRLIRESAGADDLPVEHKALLQKFAGAQLSSFMEIGLSEVDKMETYEQCLQDIAEMNQFTVGSIQALNALLTNHDILELRKLAEEFDLTRLVITELAQMVGMDQTDFTDPFSLTGFSARIQMLARIIDMVPDSITPELGDLLWRKVFMCKTLAQQGRRALWDMLCGTTRYSAQANSFIERCIQVYLPELSPSEDYLPEVLLFAKQTINYEVRFNPPPMAGENEVVTIPGMDRIWSFILTAPPGTIETDATAFAIEVYLDQGVINRSPRSAVEATHIALVDRCVDQLKSAASRLKAYRGDISTTQDEPMQEVASNPDMVQAEELRFSRSLLFLRQFLQGLRSRPQYSPPQNLPPDLPGKPVQGEVIDIRYQTFNGGTQSKVRTLPIGDLSTAAELVETLVRVTGFTKFSTISGGQRTDLLEKPDMTIRDLKLGSGLLLIRRDSDSRELALAGRRQSLTLVDSEVLKHFDDLYDLLVLEDHLAREIYDFLVVFPPQDRVLQLVKSVDKTEDDMFPMDKPYSLLYSVNALSVTLREESLEASPNQECVSHSVSVLVSALTRPAMSDALGSSPAKLLFATHMVECLLYALLVRPALPGEASTVPNPAALAQQLFHFMEVARRLPGSYLPETGIAKLICNSFAVLTEGSVRDLSFWEAIKQQAQFDELLRSLLLEEHRQPIRKGIAENVAVTCSPSKLLRKPSKSVGSDTQETRGASASDNPIRIEILATIWDAFVKTFPVTLDHARQCQEFFEIANLVFRSVAERSPHDLAFSEYLKQWSATMLRHRTEEFVGREPVDHLILGFSRLLRLCLDLASSNDTTVDTSDLAESLFDQYLFPDLSLSSTAVVAPQIPVMHGQTRQELYSILCQLCRVDEDYSKIVERLEEIIPLEDYTYSPSWGFDRYKMIRSPEGYAGLKNLSNTCYLNSLLTQLFMNVGFRDFMLQLHLDDPEGTQRLLFETKKLFGYMQETWTKSVDSQAFVDTIRTYDNEPIDVTIQMDVDEFYNLLFDRWEALILDPECKKKFRSFYGGQLVQQIKSKECPHISERLEPFSAIQCEIKDKASLEESLQAYVEGEIMQGDNKYSCTSCGRHVDAVKRACLKDVPDNLIFHLKRFDFDMVTMLRSKINDEFQFPEFIDMSPFKVEYLSDQTAEVQEDVFELVGVLVHSGTAESGHYYSYIRERPTTDARGSWVEFNDSDVSRFEQGKLADQCFGGYNDSLQSSAMGQVRFNKVWNAYMLFYQRVSSMEAAKTIYNPTKPHHPVRVPLPVALANHIVMENEIFIRTYCLMDPYHALFIRYLLSMLHETKEPRSEKRSKLDKSMIFIALDTLEQLLSRARELLGLETFVTEILGVITDVPKAAYRVLQWFERKPAAIRNLILRSPHAAVRNSSMRIIMCALSKLQDLHQKADDGSTDKEKWQMRYLDGFENVVGTLDGLWSTLYTASRSWDDYFEFLLLLASFGQHEAGIVLNNGFLLKCLEIVWLEHEDSKRLRRQYAVFIKLMEKGRRFSYKKLMDLLALLLAHIDLTVPPSPDDKRRTLPDGRYTLTTIETALIRPQGKNKELSFLKIILTHNSSPAACRNIVSHFADAEPDAGLTNPICKALEEGLRVAPANLCAPFLEATLIFCRRGPDETKIADLIDFVSKGVETINNSGGREHLSFFTSIMGSRNDRLGLNEAWFLTRLIDTVPDWAPTLLIFPERAVRNMTLEVLRQILFSGETEEMGDDWQTHQTEVARKLVHASVDRLRKTYVNVPGCNVESRSVESIRTVIEHCLSTYFGDSEEDQEAVLQAHETIGAVEDLVVDVPEELASEDWEDNSVMASDSEMGLAGSP